jgi:hypothetical protein
MHAYMYIDIHIQTYTHMYTHISTFILSVDLDKNIIATDRLYELCAIVQRRRKND